MTDIKLLPLPEKVEVDKHLPTGVRIYAYDADTLRTYASANVEHHIAAKDAEIEALRERAEQLAAALRDLLSAADQYPINYVHVGTIDRAKAILAAFDAALTEEAK